MDLHKYYAIIFITCSLLQIYDINAYPTLNIRRFFDAAVEGKYKKSDLMLPQLEDDVVELEQLKHYHNADDIADDIPLQQEKQQQQHSQQLQEQHGSLVVPLIDVQTDSSIHQFDNLPELERQLESAAASTPSVAPTTAGVFDVASGSVAAAGSGLGGAGQPENEPDVSGQGAHRPPMLPHNDGGKTSYNNQQQSEGPQTTNEGGAGLPSMAKPFYGAARLAFGQNPEVLPTLITTSTPTPTIILTPTTTKTTTSTSISEVDDYKINLPPGSYDANDDAHQNVKIAATITPPPSEATSTIGHQSAVHPLRPSNPEPESPETTQDKTNNLREENKETVSDAAVDELEATRSVAARRSVPHLMTPKTAESLLKHKNGQYSSFDMAQYVFWTGDEVGVARAVEEFIDQGLMSRENALKFLREIRLGIEYLQKSYASRVFPEEIRENNIKKSFASPAKTTTSTTTSTTTTTTEKPFPRVHEDVGEDHRKNNLHLQKSIDSLAMWSKLQELNNGDRQELNDYDEAVGRAKISEFLYTEYTLEEILYNLAKVMFTQSLAQGSRGEAQHELQKLTDFLEREGNRGIIPLDLQKKVLHVLLTALSDTLIEHPELLPAARSNLGNSFNSLPIRNYDTFK